jgi:peroxiredoxin
LEIYTGLPYTDGRSDLDVVVAGVSMDEVARIVELADTLETSFPVRIDVEVQLEEGWGVNGRELLSGGDTVLVKGICEVKLARRGDLL